MIGCTLCRLRLPNAIRGDATLVLVQPGQLNPNPFYQVARIKPPLISEKSSLQGIQLPETNVYDFETEKGESYTLTDKRETP